LLGIEPMYLQAGGFILAALILGIVFRVRRMHAFEFILVFAVVCGAAFFFTTQVPLLSKMRLDQALKGGTQLTLQAISTDQAPVTKERLEASISVIRERVDKLGVSEAQIYGVPTKNRIEVSLSNVTRAEAMDIVRIAYLTFQDAEGNLIVTGSDLIKAQEALEQDGVAAYIRLELTAEAKKRFADATTRIYGGRSASRQIYIYLDKDLVSAPTVQAANIEDPIIQGYQSLGEARRLATILNIGALPLQLNVVQANETSASLGADSLRRSQMAALIGIAAVAAFMILFYRGAGVIADFALIVYAILVIGALVSFKATLTLPGVAGLVIGVGMAVDANVLIFERIKDHLRMGRTLRAALDSGFVSAMRTIVDANVTTLVAVAVLFYLGTGPVKGFAVTLGTSIIVSMLTAVVFSQYVLRLVINSGLVRKASVLFGEKEANLSGPR
jgi:preprotein translocase subunit SecD